MKTSQIKITAPSDILHEAIASAIKPYRTELAAAVARDIELERKASAVHPDAMRAEANALIGRANAGDDSALTELEKYDGEDNYVRTKSGMYHLYADACRANSTNTAPLLAAFADDLISGMEQACQTIQRQFAETMAALGELNPGLSEWDGNIRNRCNGIRQGVRLAENGVGLNQIFTGLGLLSFLAE